MYQDYFKNDSVAQTYIKNNDLYNLGHYIRQHSFVENRNDAARLYKEGSDLIKQGRIYNSLLIKGDDEQKQAVSFLNAINNGSTLPKYLETENGKVENKFTKNFIEQVNSYFNKGDVARFIFQPKVVKRNPIPVLGFLTDWMVKDAKYETDGYEDFLNNIGMSDVEFQNYIKASNGKVGIKNGVHYMDLTNSNIRVLGRISQALNKTKDANSANRWNASMLKYKTDDDGNRVFKNGAFEIDEDSNVDIDDYNSDKTYQSDLTGESKNDNPIGNYLKFAIQTGSRPGGIIEQMSRDAIGDLFDRGINILVHHFSTIGGVIDSAENTQNELYELNEIDNKAFQVQRTGYKSAAHKRLEDAWQSGELESGEYNTSLKMLDERYDLIIGTAPYTQFKVYSNIHNEEGNTALSEISLEDKATIKEYISKAYQNNSLKYDIGNYGDMGGVYIEIPSGGLSFKDRAKYLTGLKGQENDIVTIFVPNLLPKAQYDLLDSHTEVQASRELQSMQKYKYDYELSDGSKLGIDDSGQYFKVDEYGNKRSILPDEALNDMNREKIIDVAAEQMHDAAYKYNKEKNLDDSTWAFDKQKLSNIAGWCVNSVFELYPDIANEKDPDKLQRIVKSEAFKLYNQIRGRLNFSPISIEYFDELYKEITQ